MTATRDFEHEWMQTSQTRKVFPVKHPKLGETYGDFENGNARRVYMPKITHLQQSHSSAAIAQALDWIRSALEPGAEFWIPSHQQIWQIKEWSTLVAMLACFASLGPLGLVLLRTSFFSALQSPVSGNYACTDAGEPAIFDPAVYYGDREADLAMTELFGGFGADFYAAYRAHYPLDPGYAVGRTLYNVYHILNRLNMFGGGYHAQAQGMIDALLAEL